MELFLIRSLWSIIRKYFHAYTYFTPLPHTVGSVLCWPVAPECVLECGWYTQGPGFSLCQQIIIANSFLFRGGTLGPSSLLHAGIFSGLYLCRSVCCGSLFEFVCAWDLLGLEDAVSLESAITFSHTVSPPLYIDPQTLRGGVCLRVPLRAECSKASSSAHCSAVGLCVSSCLPQKETSLMSSVNLIGAPVSVAAVETC